jgi:hypothetical protein
MDIRGFKWYEKISDTNDFNVQMMVGFPGGSTVKLESHKEDCESMGSGYACKEKLVPADAYVK